MWTKFTREWRINVKKRPAVVFCVLTVAVAAQCAGLQKWTAQNGEEITAEFITIKDGNAYFLNKGLTNGIPLKWLVDESRERAEGLVRQREKARVKALTPAQKAATIEPLVYTDGKVKHNLLFSSSQMDVYFSEAAGHAEIFVKEDGKFLSEPLAIGFSVRERVDNRTLGVPVVGGPIVEETGKGKILLRRSHVYNVKTEVHLSFDGSSLSVGYMLYNPDPGGHRISAELGMSVRPSFHMEKPGGKLDFVYYNPRLDPGGAQYPEIEKLMGGWAVNFSLATKNKDVQTSFPYLKSTRQFPGGIDAITLSGGPHGKNTVKISRMGDECSLWARLYTGKSPANGFGIGFGKKVPSSPASTGKAQLVVEVN